MENRRFASVICEYNPFHYGHLHQLERIKSEFGAVVCIMSGDVVQRGDCAVAGKYVRARAAVESGADLVLELPAPWCFASAADFARAGVFIASAIGSDALAFGAEGDKELLFSVAALFKNDSFAARLKELSGGGSSLSYPSAFTRAIEEFIGPDAAAEMKKPNNILAVEYIKNLGGAETEPFVIPRAPGFASSSELRSLCDRDLIGSVPPGASEVFAAELGSDFRRDISRLDSWFIAFFRGLSGAEELKNVYGMTDDLAAKLVRGAKRATGFYGLCSACVDKKYTAARVRRAVLSAAFGITASAVRRDPPFAAVLAADEKGCEILAANRENKMIEIITKPAAAFNAGREPTKEYYALSKRISDIIALTAPSPSPADKAFTPFIKKVDS